MHLLISILLTALGIVVGIGLLIVLITLSIAIGVWLHKPLERAFNPGCLHCHGRSLQRDKLPYSDAKEFQYYRCIRCLAHLKRSSGGEWVTLPRAIARDVDRGKFFARPANLVKCAEDRESHDPLGSWFGSVQVALPEEGWPEYAGVPMLPLCQLRCAEIPNLPPAFKNAALICVFVALVGEEVISPQGDRWVLRTYAKLDDLIPIAYPGDAADLHTYPIAWNPVNDYPTYYSDIPETMWMDWDNLTGVLHPSYTGSKVGGYGWNVQRNAVPDQKPAALVFQFVIQGDFPWLRGEGGTLYFAHSCTEGVDTWRIDCKPPPIPTLVMPASIGCEVEGMQISVRRPLGRNQDEALWMSYQGRSGTVYRLEDLQGLVKITTAVLALQFVRLRTSGLLHDPARYEYEVFTKAEYEARPTWAKPLSRVLPIKRGDNGVPYIMCRTVLDPEVFQKCGFKPPVVEPIEGGFRIERWVCRPDRRKEPEDVYRKLVETVKENGTYLRTVLRQLTVLESGVYDSF